MGLEKSFDEALRDFAPLKQHITSQEDAAEVEDEFRQSWHAEAPEALRQVLEELLDPVAAAANAKETSNFLAQMVGYSGEANAEERISQEMAIMEELRSKL